MLKNKVGVTTGSYVGLALKDALKGISKAGFSYVEIVAAKGITGAEHIRPDLMGDVEIEALKKQLKDCNLELMSIAGYSDLTKAENVPYTKDCIDVAKKLGIKIITTGCSPKSNSQIAVKQFYKNMKELSEYAVENGVTICLETHGGINKTGEKAAKVIQNINSEGVKINYDTGNIIFYSDVRPEEDIKYALEYLGHLHLKDKIGGKGIWNFPPLGDGNIDFALLLNILKENGYSGSLSVEIEFQKGVKRTVELVNQAVKKSHDFLDNLFLKLSY